MPPAIRESLTSRASAPNLFMMNTTSSPLVTLRNATFLIAALAVLLAGCHRKNVDDLLATGETAMQAGNVGDAERAYDAAIAAAPNDPRTHIARGNLYVFEKKPEAAQVEFMK